MQDEIIKEIQQKIKKGEKGKKTRMKIGKKH